MDASIGLVTVAVVLLTFVVSVLATQVARARRDAIVLRHLPAYARLPLFVSEALESDRPVHFSLGSSSFSGINTPLTLANVESFTLLANRAIVGMKSPLMTMSETATLPLGYDILRRAYRTRNRRHQFDMTAVQWYPAGVGSLAFAAAITAVAGDYRVGTHVLLGSFGGEVALILDAAARRGQHAIAASDQLEGQAIAYALSDEVLIGEEMFAGGAYLGGGASQQGGVVALDILRIVLIIFLLVLTANQLSGGDIAARLLGGGG